MTAKIINLGWTSKISNKGIILTGEEAELFSSESEALNIAELLINETPEGSDVYVWEDNDDFWHVGW